VYQISRLYLTTICSQQNGSVDAEPDLEFEDGVEDELEVEDDEDHVDGESTDSMVSAAVFAASTPRPDAAAAASPFLVKRTSNASGAIYYQARAVNLAAGEEQASKV
jgi:hypothetical protein